MKCQLQVKNLLWLTLQVLMCTGIADYHLCPSDHDTLICNTNHIYLEWNISTISQHLRETRSISYLDPSPIISPITWMNSINFTFSRDSSPRALPLVSTMTIKNVTSSLEGTVVSCTGINSSSSSVILVITIHVYDISVDFPNAPKVTIRTDMIHFRNDNFTITLEWPQLSGETYTIATTPEPVHTSFNMNTSLQLVMLYNIHYDVDVTATLCGHRNATTFRIHYSECGYPIPEDDMVTVSYSEGPWIEGSIINYNCAPGLKVTETNTSTCMDNGQWKPDPLDIKCTAICGPPSPLLNGYIYSYSNKSLQVIVVCRNGYGKYKEKLYIANCHLNGTWQPNPSDLCDADNESLSNPEVKQQTTNVSTVAIILVVLSSFFFFIFGMLCGQITRVIRKGEKNPLQSENSPDYEVVPPINLPSIANGQETLREDLNNPKKFIIITAMVSSLILSMIILYYWICCLSAMAEVKSHINYKHQYGVVFEEDLKNQLSMNSIWK